MNQSPRKQPLVPARVVIFLLLATALIVCGFKLGWFDGPALLQKLADIQDDIRKYVDANLFTSVIIASGIYIGLSTIAFPFSVLVSICIATVFPYYLAVLFVTISATIGATCGMLLSRYLFRDMLRRWFGERFKQFDELWQRDGTWFLVSMRLAPYVPFFTINVFSGLTNMKVRTFFWVTLIAILPATMVNLFVGSQLEPLREIADNGIPSLLTWELVVALSILAVMPLVIRFVFLRRNSVSGFSQPQLPGDEGLAEEHGGCGNR
ncbi:MAG: hypothetical protein CMM04_08250 [Rhodopirellula sp.]|nr:hypothetical protein [Rhodopirellula sp.]HCP83473.1 hypothetical protein [Planctomycetaceae bacterium]